MHPLKKLGLYVRVRWTVFITVPRFVWEDRAWSVAIGGGLALFAFNGVAALVEYAYQRHVPNGREAPYKGPARTVITGSSANVPRELPPVR